MAEIIDEEYSDWTLKQEDVDTLMKSLVEYDAILKRTYNAESNIKKKEGIKREASTTKKIYDFIQTEKQKGTFQFPTLKVFNIELEQVNFDDNFFEKWDTYFPNKRTRI